MKPTALVPVDGTNPYFQIGLIISLDDGNGWLPKHDF
jgi:hypothetical protein